METTSSGGIAQASAETRVEAPPGPAMHLFVVERRLPGLTERGLGMLQAALLDATARIAACGPDMRYLWSIFIPSQDRLFSLFASVNLDLVLAANTASLVPFLSIDAASYLPVRLARPR